MPCIHGLDEINCSICKITNNTTPKITITSKDIRTNPLNPKDHSFESNLENKDIFENKLVQKNKFLKLNLINPIPKSPLLEDFPNFKNKMFLERLKEIDLNSPDKYRISKKIPIESPEWKFEKDNDLDK